MLASAVLLIELLLWDIIKFLLFLLVFHLHMLWVVLVLPRMGVVGCLWSVLSHLLLRVLENLSVLSIMLLMLPVLGKLFLLMNALGIDVLMLLHLLILLLLRLAVLLVAAALVQKLLFSNRFATSPAVICKRSLNYFQIFCGFAHLIRPNTLFFFGNWLSSGIVAAV